MKSKKPKEASLANLNKWKPGQSGNLKGRPPKVRHIPSILMKIGAENLPFKAIPELQKFWPDADKFTMLEAVLRMTYLQALNGTGWALEFIAVQTEGKVPDRIELSIYDDVDLDKIRALDLDDLVKLAYAEN